MTKEQIEIFEKTFVQLCGLYDDITVLVKKNPNDAMNTFKLRNINKVICSANEIVGDTKPFDDFDGFDIDGDMPSNSDVTMVLGQYINCLELIKKIIPTWIGDVGIGMLMAIKRDLKSRRHLLQC